MSETVWDRVAAQAARTPEAVAVVPWTYAELVDRVSAVASTISGYAGPGQVVAIDVTGAPAGLVAFLATARAGCTALPLSAESPPPHRALMLEDARPALVVTEDDGTCAVRPTAYFGFPAGDTPPSDIAYVMYTSGSTGRPKGVLVPHAALVRRLAGLARVPGLAAGESMLAMTALSFDISLAEILLPVSVGATVVPAPPAARVDPEVFAGVVASTCPTVLQATPSFWRLALAWGWTGAPAGRIWCGGEPLTPSLAAKLLPRCAQLWNVYGPTEATIWATAAHITDPDAVSLGTALPGTGVLLLADDGSPITEPGTPGRLVLSGDGVAAGYLDRPELTAARFPGGCYHTGDLAAYRADGTLEYLGREDNQIKLRGHRIELGEIEAVAERCPGITAAVAVLKNPDTTSAHIALYVTGEITARSVRTWFADQLPPPMRPTTVEVVAELPRTSAGKVDRQALTSR
ncbi:amino acid adenylation domain-containing protein [Amycolatopsis sp. NBC_01488]|uniref:amino acid adenylation domain-containing protein n=1 Tax=Amycolatopsis sp. NBC_01488 TaxID=2903563 RepID=UPI002E2C667E|nr:amino acid adenylation domain-containing protein [Amycolatopsis sp. NBC_01488]